ncbi:MAG: hypothetical protein ACKV2T_11160 [Kofleriaceae bacterium]
MKLLVALVLGTVGIAAAQGTEGQVAPAKEPVGGPPPTAPPTSESPSGPSEPVSYSHKGQIQASLRLSLGMRAIIAYDDADYCGDSDTMNGGNAAVCTSRVPFAFDLEVGYGIARNVDLIAELRVGIEEDFTSTGTGAGDGPRMFHFSPGVRFFFSDAKTMKLFATAQVVFDFAGYKDATGQNRGADFGVRNLNGLWLDLDRAYGFYAYVGETATFGRWLLTQLELGVGVSARFR